MSSQRPAKAADRKIKSREADPELKNRCDICETTSSIHFHSIKSDMYQEGLIFYQPIKRN
jgi:hypothetical protein